MKVYLSGPMSGYPEYNFPAFTAAAAVLRSFGYTVVSPHEIDHAEPAGVGSLPWGQYMRNDLCALLDCDAIALLPGWPQSTGAKLELQVALGLSKSVYFYAPNGAFFDMNKAAD